MTALKSAIAAVLLLILPGLLLAQPAVSMREEPLVIPTYRVLPPEKNPIFYTGRSYQGAKGPIYPYPLYDRLTDIKEDRTYKALYLENQYVQFSILPEIGGRIFTGLDRTNNYDFIYRQHVIKPALIGMIGAWISGGVEWNIPHHHRASTFMAVDHALVENSDGSKTIWVGEIELRHRMKWLVGLTLYPDKSYLKVTVKLHNRTPLPHSLLYFANIAVHANPDYQVIFPPSTEFGTQHSKVEFVHWPVGRGFYGGRDRTGIDLSWWKNLPTPASIFCWNYEDDFFGGYDHGRKGGIAVIADHHIAPGKKFFEWGNGNEGRMWDKILSDADGPYLELMAGGYSDNQPDYSWIQPTEMKVVEQYYYPIRELGGIKNANIDAAVNLGIKDSKARMAFNATSAFKDATVLLTVGEREVYRQRIAIAPDAPFVKEVDLPPNTKPEDVRAALVASTGRELVSYRPSAPKNSPMPPKVQPPPAPKDVKTADELYLAGQRLEQFHSPALEPYPYYDEALQRDPGDYRANVALAILYLKRGMYPQAQEKLSAAIARATRNHTSPRDGEAFYYMGAAQRAQGRPAEAENAFQKAAWSLAWQAPANQALAELACQRGDFAGALAFADRALNNNARNTRALNLRAAILRKLNRAAEAAAESARVLQIDPLDHFAANERYLAAPSDGSLNAIVMSMRGDPAAYLELAADYGAAGLYEEATGILSRYLDRVPDKARSHPLISYFLGYYATRKGDTDAALVHYRRAASLPADYCFPFQLECIDVLKDAMQRNPQDAKAPYYLGNLLYDPQPEQAIALWEQSRQVDPAFATVHRNLGFAYARVKKDNALAIASMEKAIAADPTDPKLYAELDALYDAGNVDPKKRLALLEKNHAVVAQRDDALLREITLHMLAGNYDRAVELFDGHHFRLWEGEGGLHDIYADAHLLRGQRHFAAKRYDAALKDYEAAMQYPDTLETARPTRGEGRQPQFDYLLGELYEATGQPEKARAAFRQSASAPARGEPTEVRYYQALALRKLGQEANAAEMFDDLVTYGQQRLQVASGLDFFAKFGTRQSPAAQKARALYLIGLGHLGKSQKEEAKRSFQAALQSQASHLGAMRMLAELQ